MPNESGDNKVCGNFRKLIDELSADSGYNPANTKLKLPALNPQYTAADAAVDALAAALAPNKLAISGRVRAFNDLRPLLVRSRNYLKASGAAEPVVEDAEQLLRKLRGGNRRPKPKVDVANAASPTEPVPANTRSTSQMSFDNQLGHFQAYIEILKTISEYNPNEADLKVTALTAYADDLIEKNTAVNTTSAAVTQVRGARDRLLYLDDDSVVNTARQVKSYIQAALGSDSALFMKIKGLKFAAPQK